MLLTLFQHTDHTTVGTIEWADLMRGVRDGQWRAIVDRCRKEAFGGDELRRRLPAFGVSVTFIDGDEAANVVKYTGIVAIDFDKALTSGCRLQQRLDECRAICAAEPSVVGFYVTKGGCGFRVFVRVNTGLADHKRIYHPLQEHFERLLGLQANDRYMDITRLSFVSSDADCFFRRVEDAPPFDAASLYPGVEPCADATTMDTLAARVVSELSQRYELRRNLTEGAVQLRIGRYTALSVGDCHQWRNLDEPTADRLVTDLNANGLALTYNQFRWIIDCAGLLPTHDAVRHFVDHLPQHDGRDHVALIARRLGALDSRFAAFLRQWLADMLGAWMGLGSNKRVMVLHADGLATHKTEWLLSLMPRPLQRYLMLTAAPFAPSHYADGRTWLLIVVADFDGNRWECIERIMADNPRASVVVTAQSRLADAPPYVSQFRVGPTATPTAITDDETAQLYAELQRDLSQRPKPSV